MSEHFKLAIEDLAALKRLRVILALPGNVKIYAWMVDDTLDFSVSAEYEPLFSKSLAQAIAGKVGSRIEQGLEVFQKYTQTQIRHLKETVLSYNSTERPEFTLSLMFVALNRNDDVREKARLLMEGCMPVRSPQGLLDPPWGYSINPSEEAIGEKFAVTIGDWFKAANQILTEASFQFSREVIETGNPLYARGSIRFKSFKQLYADELKNFFPLRTAR